MLKRLLVATSLVAALLAPAHAATVAEGESLADNQKLRYWLLDAIKTLDPQKNADVEGSHVLRQLFEGLMNEDETGAMVPGAAESYEVSDDGLTYIFKLREARWSDGDPVTAGDFVYGWRRAVDPETASEYAWYMELMNLENATAIVNGDMPPDELGVRAVDDRTLEVTLSTTTPYFIKTLSLATTFPAKQSVIEEHGDQWVQPGNLVGNGAYVLDEHTVGVKVALSKNSNYWNADETIIDSVEFITINDQNIALTRYLAGELDWFDSMPAGQAPRLKQEYPDQFSVLPEACTYGYLFNVGENGPEALKDARVRRALSYGINRDVIVEKVLRGGQRPAYFWTHWAIEGFEEPEMEVESWTQEERTAKARELLAEAGYGPDNSLNITIQYNSSDDHKKIAIAVQQFWKSIGVNSELANYEWKVHMDRMRAGEYDVARYAWCGDYNEASTFLDYFRTGGLNDTKWSNEEYDRLLAEAKNSDNPAELYKEAELILNGDEPALAPVYFYTRNILADARLRGIPLENVMYNWYAKDLYRAAE